MQTDSNAQTVGTDRPYDNALLEHFFEQKGTFIVGFHIDEIRLALLEPDTRNFSGKAFYVGGKVISPLQDYFFNMLKIG